ncbi:MAG: methylated-DNA--[protein]-cysteine S-methyltransferase [Dehalococcoidia bacterium]|jgi:methylated-DNA-[protein]-cysteine S-methyltransferase
MKFDVVQTDLGWMGFGLSEHGLRVTTMPTATRKEAEEEMRARGAATAATDSGDWPERLRSCARGEDWSPNGDIDLSQGTEFQRRVWRALLDIPRGETRTYKQVAEQIGRPGAARAVGQAVGANPMPVVVPCHRVVAQDGLGGFGGGLPLKKRLLRLEAATL